MHEELEALEGRVSLRPHRGLVRVARWLLGIAMAMAVIGGAVKRATGSEEMLLVLLLSAFVLALAAFAGWLSRTALSVELGEEVVKLRRSPFPILGRSRHPVPRAEVTALSLHSAVRHSGKGTHWQVWVVDLVCVGPPDPAGKRERTVRIPIDLSEELAWRFCEALALQLGVPIVDRHGSPMRRMADHLDHSLGEVLRQQGAAPPDPGPAPARLRATSDTDRLVLEWWVTRLGPPIGAAGLTLLLTGLAVGSLLSDSGLLALLFFPLALAFVWAFPDALKEHGTHRLSLDAREARLELREGRWRDAVPAAEVESVRIDSYHRSLKLVTDRKVLSCPMSDEQARWARNRICAWAYDHALDGAVTPSAPRP